MCHLRQMRSCRLIFALLTTSCIWGTTQGHYIRREKKAGDSERREGSEEGRSPHGNYFAEHFGGEANARSELNKLQNTEETKSKLTGVLRDEAPSLLYGEGSSNAETKTKKKHQKYRRHNKKMVAIQPAPVTAAYSMMQDNSVADMLARALHEKVDKRKMLVENAKVALRQQSKSTGQAATVAIRAPRHPIPEAAAESDESDTAPDLNGQEVTGQAKTTGPFDMSSWKRQLKHALSEDQKWMDGEMKRLHAKRNQLDEAAKFKPQKQATGIDAGVLPPETGDVGKANKASVSPARVVQTTPSSALLDVEADDEVRQLGSPERQLEEFKKKITKQRDEEKEREEHELRKSARAWSKKRDQDSSDSERAEKGLPPKSSKPTKTATAADEERAKQDRAAEREMQDHGVHPAFAKMPGLL